MKGDEMQGEARTEEDAKCVSGGEESTDGGIMVEGDTTADGGDGGSSVVSNPAFGVIVALVALIAIGLSVFRWRG